MVHNLTLQNTKISKWEYFIVFLFVVMCGFTSGDIIPGKSWILSFCGIIYIAQKKNKQSLYPLYFIILAYLLVGYLHIERYNYYSERTFIKIPLLILSGFYVCDKLGDRFKYAYMDIMTIIALISLIFFFIMILTGYVPTINFLNSNPLYKGIFIFNERLSEIERGRNCGPFWEPGAYAGNLLMVGILFFNKLDMLWKMKKRNCIILLIALFTTFSSQGFLTLAILLLLYLFRLKFNTRIFLFAFSFIIVFSIAYISFDFLRLKVNEQLELAKDWESEESLYSANRFSTSLLDWYYITKEPLIGNTENVMIRYRDHPLILNVIEYNGGYGSGSGTTSFIACFGFPLFILWLFLLNKSLKREFTYKERIMVIVLYVILGFGEAYFSYIYYMSLPFILYKKID